MSKKKKWIVTLLSLAILAGSVTGVYELLRANREPAKVYPVEQFCEENFYNYENYLSGEVRTDRLQTVYLSPTQEITEILVSQGEEVKKGDPLICFNTSLSQLELERKAIEIQKKEDELEKAQRTYRRYFGQSYVIPPVSAGQNASKAPNLSAEFAPGVELVLLSAQVPLKAEALTAPVTEPTEPVTEPTEPVTEPTEPVTEPTEPATEPTEPEEPGVVRTLTLVAGNGSPEDPELYVMGSAYGLTPEVLAELLGDRDTVDLVLANTLEDQLAGAVTSAWGLTMLREGEGWSVRFWDASPYLDRPLSPLEEIEPVEPEPDDFDEPFFPDVPIGPVGPTWAELQEIRKELEEKIRSLDLEIRKNQVVYRSMEAELGDGIIRAEFDGVILSLNDEATALETGDPLLKLSGGGGYKIVCNVNELQVEELSIGQTAMVSSWYGDSYPAVVAEISQTPATEEYNYDGNQNVSYYPVTLEVDAAADLGDSYWVEVLLDGSEAAVEGYYLYSAFVLNENGKSYVLIRGEDGLLEKRFLNTGRTMYGYMIEVLGGLSKSDYIAFPYAKSAQEGAKTDEGNYRDLVGY